MKVDIYMPWYFGDYIKDTGDLTAEEHGAYLLLLGHMWNRGGVLPSDPSKLARLACVKTARWPSVWASIGRFFDKTEDVISQGRLMQELEKALRKRAGAVEAGKASGFARRTNGTRTTVERPLNERSNGSPTTVVTETERNANPSESESGKIGGDPDPDAPPPDLWSAPVWLRKFGLLWAQEHHGMFYGQAGDSKACGTLSDQLEALPREERLRTQGRADVMIREFLAGTSPSTIQRKHPFAFFVGDFGALRVGGSEARRPQRSPALERAAREWAGR